MNGSVASAQSPVGPQTVDVSVGSSESGSNEVRPLALTNGEVGTALVRKRATSVAVQTMPKENAVFSFARLSSSSSDSALASSDETEEKKELEDDQPPRPLEECLALFRSDVSVVLLVVRYIYCTETFGQCLSVFLTLSCCPRLVPLPSPMWRCYS